MIVFGSQLDASRGEACRDPLTPPRGVHRAPCKPPRRMPGIPWLAWLCGRRAGPGGVPGDSSMAGTLQFSALCACRMVRWATRWLAVCALASLCGCNAMKLGYQQGDHLAYWWIDHYVDVSDAQEPATKEAIARFFAWHRKTQLPEITAVLAKAKGEVSQPLDGATVREMQEASRRLARESFDYAIPDLARMLLTLTPDQVKRMEDKLAESNAKYRRKYMSGNDRKQEDARFDKIMDYAKLVYGSFSDEQERQIRSAMGPTMQAAPARYEERLNRQREWLGLVHRVVDANPKPSVAEVETMLRSYGDRWQKPPHNRARRWEAYNEAGIALTVTIANLTTPQQKAHAVERFQGWIDDTRSLAREGQRGNAQAAN